MKTYPSFPAPRPSAAFSTIELVVAVVLFSVATSGVLYMGKSMRDHQKAAIASNQQNAYATFQSQVALQGIDPLRVANPMASAINEGGTISGGAALSGFNLSANFEQNAVTEPLGAERDLAGSVRVDAVNYNVAAAGNQTARGAGMGFAIETAGPAAPSSPNAIQLVPPVFQITGDLTTYTFPLAIQSILTEPSSNPPGTVYRYTTDGSTPTGTSPVWDDQSAWTPDTFPGQVTLRAFNPDPQYAASGSVSASYSLTLSGTYARGDGRGSDLYGFTLAEAQLGSSDPAGVVLTDSAGSYAAIYYTLDGSNPANSPTALTYGGSFAPDPSLFNPSVTLNVVAMSSNSAVTSWTATYTLTPDAIGLSPPSFVTSNASPLSPGTPVVISLTGSNGSPRTAVNNGAPAQSSSSATSFPLN